jgi:hypothetical protein
MVAAVASMGSPSSSTATEIEIVPGSRPIACRNEGADRERQQLSAIEPDTTAARMNLGSIDHYGVRTRPTQCRFGARNVAQFDRDGWHRRPPSSSRLATSAEDYATRLTGSNQPIRLPSMITSPMI